MKQSSCELWRWYLLLRAANIINARNTTTYRNQAPAAPVPAVPELDAASKAALANWNVMYGPGRDGSWAPVGGEGGIPDDPVGPIGFGKAVCVACVYIFKYP